MVLPNKVGKQRSFGRGLLFTILSLGIYSYYWNYKVHNELFEQFELKKEGRDEGIVFFIVGIFVSVILWIFQYKAVENLNYVRARSGMPVRLTPGAFLAWRIVPTVAAVVLLVPLFVLAPFLFFGGDPGRATEANAAGFVGALVLVAIVFVVVALGGQMVAYAKYQESLNEVWDRYDERRAALVAQGAVPPAPPPLM
jgi:hypothetical protein